MYQLSFPARLLPGRDGGASPRAGTGHDRRLRKSQAERPGLYRLEKQRVGTRLHPLSEACAWHVRCDQGKWLLADEEFLDRTFQQLCKFTHSRPNSSDGHEGQADRPNTPSDSVNLGSNPGPPARESASNRCVFVVSSLAGIVLKLPRVSCEGIGGNQRRQMSGCGERTAGAHAGTAQGLAADAPKGFRANSAEPRD